MTTNYDEWAQKFDEQIAASIKVSDKTVVDAAKEFLVRVEKRTPVGDPSLWKYPAHKGYKPGTLKASWTLSYTQTAIGVYATISNNVPYAERVEFGWSSQAPEGMMRVTALEWPNIVDKLTNENKL